ncbi:hypothetical protein QL285_091197 [Trifolium repens]|nr:hypothetical protein QL285_091197 [Trifolium repens]
MEANLYSRHCHGLYEIVVDPFERLTWPPGMRERFERTLAEDFGRSRLFCIRPYTLSMEAADVDEGSNFIQLIFESKRLDGNHSVGWMHIIKL